MANGNTVGKVELCFNRLPDQIAEYGYQSKTTSPETWQLYRAGMKSYYKLTYQLETEH